ncbi:MAG: nucleotide exchange factor GrpE [Candidatus Anstonellales archaeon]
MVSETEINQVPEKKGEQKSEEESGRDEPALEKPSPIDELKDKYLRLAAEFDNYKKRMEKEKTELLRRGEEKMILSLLPVLDDLEAAVDSVEDEQAKKGILLIKEKIFSLMEREGLEKINTDGTFDESIHEAVLLEKGNEDGRIIRVISPGYKFKGKVIRYAKVVVSKK